MKENRYQSALIKRIKQRFPDCLVLKNDPSYIQGIPDLLLLFGPFWAALEVKASTREPFQPNQEYYLDLMDKMSFAVVICPENEDLVLNAIQHALGLGGEARLPIPQQLPLDQLQRRQA